ncbi:nucleotide exchange factor GrpE [Candidatus Kaiserbacteria bacterium]|nr:nucleotide exchange factor GrpE [Candidatus Kaiserbacteria bacterium]NCT01725.1 nucleotide exchange factor GrpE [Candidatus Parcubacteria bacterium]
MVYMKNNESELEIETTNDDTIELEETELIDEEEKSNDKLKKLREKVAQCEDEKKQLLDDLQRSRADFLNARKRLEEERARDHIRQRKAHVEELLPLCDSFEMAMSNKEAWEKTDEIWRKGIEGINNQLMRLLESYDVKVIDPKGTSFDPYRDEAVGTEVVEDEKLVDTIVTVLQRGYELQVDDTTEVIRHARVTTGVLKN